MVRARRHAASLASLGNPSFRVRDIRRTPLRIIVTPSEESRCTPLIKRMSRGRISHGRVSYGRASCGVYISLSVYLTSVYFILCTINISYSLISFKRSLPGKVPYPGTWYLNYAGA
jgi:hypothetical protein